MKDVISEAYKEKEERENQPTELEKCNQKLLKANEVINAIHELTLRPLNADVVLHFINSHCKEYFNS